MKFDLKRLFLLNNLITALLPIILIGIVSISAVRSHLAEDQDQNGILFARSLAGQITTYLREPIGTLNLVSRHLVGRSHSHAERGALLNLLAESYEYIDALYLLNDKGIVKQAGFKSASRHNGGDYQGMDFSGVEICRQARAGQRLYWAPSTSIASGDPIMSFCAPLADGSVLAELRLADLGRIINESSSDRAFIAFIIDKSGRIIAHPDPEIMRQKENVGNIRLFRQALEGKIATENFSLHQVDYRGTALRIPDLDWVLVVAKEMNVVMAPVYTMQEVLFSGMLATVVLALALGYIGSRMLRRPFDQLTEVARRVIREDYSSVQQVSSTCTEINILSETLCRMVDAICARETALNEQTEELMTTEESLRELNLLLEEKVAARTASLEMAGEELTILNRNLLQRSRELEEANRQLESFACTVSHDLRAPLRHAGRFAAILLEEQTAKLEPEGVELAQRIVSSCNHMEQLLSALLEFSRVALCPLKQTTVQTEKMVREIVAEQQGELDGRSHQFVVQPLPDCRADVILLRQVWVNLLGNAVKYTRKCESARIEIGSVMGADEVTFFVRDNGAGFDMADYNRLFGVFQRLHSARDFEGTGVGLAIVANIVNRHGGRIWADSRVGEGTVFWFTLPLLLPAETAAAAIIATSTVATDQVKYPC